MNDEERSKLQKQLEDLPISRLQDVIRMAKLIIVAKKTTAKLQNLLEG